MDRNNVLDLASKRSEALMSPCAACAVRDLSICGVLDPEQLEQLTAITGEVTVAPGQAVFYEADPAENLYVIKSGCARVYKLLADGRRMITGFLFTADLIGLAEKDTYSHTCEAVTKLTLCRFSRRPLQEFFDRYPVLERRMLDIATNELAAAQDQMVLLGRKTAQEKIASFLLLLLRRQQRHGNRANSLALPMTRSDIGDHLGLTTESVSRCFTQFRKRGVIALESAQHVEILDSAGLIALSGSGGDGLEPTAATFA